MDDASDSVTVPDIPSAAGAAYLSVLINSRPWNLETFKDLLLFVMDFRCKFTWEEKSRITIIKILEDKKETFEEFLIEMAQLIPEGGPDSVYEAETVQRYRSGFEFLLDDFPDQLSFCQSLPSLLQWDNSLCVEDVSFCSDYSEDQVFADYRALDTQERLAMQHRKETHFWWQRYDDRENECQTHFQSFLLEASGWIAKGLRGETLMKLFSKHMRSVAIPVMPREQLFAEYHLRNLKPHLRDYITYEWKIRDKEKCFSISRLASLIRVAPALLGELEEMTEYQEMRSEELAYYAEQKRILEEKRVAERERRIAMERTPEYLNQYYEIGKKPGYRGSRVVQFHQTSDIGEEWQGWL